MRKLLIIGPRIATAGVGGVTIHVERLAEWLKKDNCSFTICDYKRESMWCQFCKIWESEVLHIHVSHPMLRLFYVLLGVLLRKKTILTIHGDLGRFSAWKNWLDRMAVTLSFTPIAINQRSFEKAQRWNRRAVLMTAFIPPLDDGFLPKTVFKKIEALKTAGAKVFVTNASAMNYDRKGNEIYGIKFLIDFLKNGKCHLFVSDPSGDYSRFFRNADIENVDFITEQHSFYALIKQSDIVVRATSTDGDSLSVREALYAGKPVVATDCVDRPSGTILFKYNDRQSFELALRHLEGRKDKNLRQNNVVKEIERLYADTLV